MIFSVTATESVHTSCVQLFCFLQVYCLFITLLISYMIDQLPTLANDEVKFIHDNTQTIKTSKKSEKNP